MLDHVRSKRKFSCTFHSFVFHSDRELRQSHLIRVRLLLRWRPASLSATLFLNAEVATSSGYGGASRHSRMLVLAREEALVGRSTLTPLFTMRRRRLIPSLEQVTAREPTVTPTSSAISSRLLPRSTRFLICCIRSGVNLIGLRRNEGPLYVPTVSTIEPCPCIAVALLEYVSATRHEESEVQV